jgi:glutamine synthetase
MSGPEPISPGMFGYSLIRAAQNQPFLRALMEELPAFGLPVEGLHSETGPGVFEAAILLRPGNRGGRPRNPLQAGRQRRIGQRFGIMPSFMAKWSTQYPGCSGHIHQSLSDGKRNVFYDARNPTGCQSSSKAISPASSRCWRTSRRCMRPP